MSTTTASPLPLPRVRGPKLEPFQGTARAHVEFLEFIGNDKDIDSKVWKVRIANDVYALKIFGFQNWEFLKMTEGAGITWAEWDPPLHRPALTPQQYIDYLDPFNCECRAYGRLKQENSEELAVRAHGYLLLTREQEREVTERLHQDYVDWENHPDLLDCAGVLPRWEAHRHERLRAIVKEYVKPEPDSGCIQPWTASQIPQMHADLERLHELGIVVRDLHAGNYLRGKLVDFSMAWTMYHPGLDRATPTGVKRWRKRDPEAFEGMIDQWAFDVQETDEVERLWTPAMSKWREGDFGVDARLYDWRKWERDGGRKNPMAGHDDGEMLERARSVEEQLQIAADGEEH